MDRESVVAVMKKGADYWRGLVAAAADIQTGHVTQFSPKGLFEALGQNTWYCVKLGPLVLQHDGCWVFEPTRDEATTQNRTAYAFKSVHEALAALRAEVTPDEPVCAEIVERIHGKEK